MSIYSQHGFQRRHSKVNSSSQFPRLFDDLFIYSCAHSINRPLLDSSASLSVPSTMTSVCFSWSLCMPKSMTFDGPGETQTMVETQTGGRKQSRHMEGRSSTLKKDVWRINAAVHHHGYGSMKKLEEHIAPTLPNAARAAACRDIHSAAARPRLAEPTVSKRRGDRSLHNHTQYNSSKPSTDEHNSTKSAAIQLDATSNSSSQCDTSRKLQSSARRYFDFD